jgi:hypothetical protein
VFKAKKVTGAETLKTLEDMKFWGKENLCRILKELNKG